MSKPHRDKPEWFYGDDDDYAAHQQAVYDDQYPPLENPQDWEY